MRKIILTIITSIVISSLIFLIMYRFMPLNWLDRLFRSRNLGVALTTINGGDTLSASRTTINNNFTALNAKLENYDAFTHVVSNTSASSTELRLTGGLISTASSTFTGLLTLTGNINASSTATSTFQSGIAISTGCFSVNGVCAGTGAGTVTSISGSGGTTGLTLTGGPITTSGTLTLGGTLVVANGGTGVGTLTSNGVLIGNGTGNVVQSAAGELNSILVSANGTPFFTRGATTTNLYVTASSTIGTLNLSNALTVLNGGTGAATFTSNGVLYGAGTSALSITGAGAVNTLLGSTGGAPAFFGTPTTTGLFTTGSTTIATLTVGGTGTSTYQNGINLITGCFSIAGTCVGGGGGSGTIAASTIGQVPYYTAATTLTGTSTIFIATNGHIGFGTTTPVITAFVFDNGAVRGCLERKGSLSGTITVDWSVCNTQTVTLSGDNVTINFSNVRPGESLFLSVCQGTTLYTITTWDTSIRWNNGASTTQQSKFGQCDIYNFRSSSATGTDITFGTANGNF